jgi:hypothetical protein
MISVARGRAIIFLKMASMYSYLGWQCPQMIEIQSISFGTFSRKSQFYVCFPLCKEGIFGAGVLAFTEYWTTIDERLNMEY